MPTVADYSVTFRDRVPDFIFEYVTIHEIGHCATCSRHKIQP